MNVISLVTINAGQKSKKGHILNSFHIYSLDLQSEGLSELFDLIKNGKNDKQHYS